MRARTGIALPIALAAVIVVAMLSAMALDAALQDLRLARSARAQAVAFGLVESGLSGVVDQPTDSTWLGSPPGSVQLRRTVVGSDTSTLTLTRLGGRLVRVSSTARSRAAGRRGDAGAALFLQIVADSGGGLRLRRLPGWWWAPDP